MFVAPGGKPASRATRFMYSAATGSWRLGLAATHLVGCRVGSLVPILIWIPSTPADQQLQASAMLHGVHRVRGEKTFLDRINMMYKSYAASPVFFALQVPQ